MPLLRGLFPGSLLDGRVCDPVRNHVTCADLITRTPLAMRYQELGPHRSVRAALARIVKFPVSWSLAITALIRILGIPLPSFLLTACHLI
jgi:hypothetical protein